MIKINGADVNMCRRCVREWKVYLRDRFLTPADRLAYRSAYRSHRRRKCLHTCYVCTCLPPTMSTDIGVVVAIYEGLKTKKKEEGALVVSLLY